MFLALQQDFSMMFVFLCSIVPGNHRITPITSSCFYLRLKESALRAINPLFFVFVYLTILCNQIKVVVFGLPRSSSATVDSFGFSLLITILAYLQPFASIHMFFRFFFFPQSRLFSDLSVASLQCLFMIHYRLPRF